MPDHCYAENEFPPQPKVIDFEVKWNSNSNKDAIIVDVSTEAAINEKLCNNKTYFDDKISSDRAFTIF